MQPCHQLYCRMSLGISLTPSSGRLRQSSLPSLLHSTSYLYQSGSNLLAQATAQGHRPRGERHRSSAGPQSPAGALVSTGSKQPRKVPSALIPGAAGAVGGTTASSAAANVGIPAPTAVRHGSSGQLQSQQQHPYANSTGAMHEYSRTSAANGAGGEDESFAGGYGGARGSAAGLSGVVAAPPIVAMGTRDVGPIAGNQTHGQYGNEEEPHKGGFFASLCRCG